MKKKYKYCDDSVYKDDTWQALSSQFKDRKEFESFYSSLNGSELRNEFLRIGSAYLFFVKNGDWHVTVQRSNPVIEYFTNSFKLVALLAIVESLSGKENIDFYDWLLEQDQRDLFPIVDGKRMRKLYDEYKQDYGSIRRCKDFFVNLPPQTQKKLRESIIIDNKPVETIQRFVSMIYQIRSRFAHESDAALEVSDIWCFSMEKNKRVAWNFPMKLLQQAFEEGVVTHFRNASSSVPAEAQEGSRDR